MNLSNNFPGPFLFAQVVDGQVKNMFGAKNCCRILFFKLPEELHSPLKSFFDYLNYTPASIPETYINSIQSDENVLKILRETL